MGIKMIDEARNRAAAANPDATSSVVRRIELAASEAFPDDMAARFDYRNQLRAAAGLPPEERRRGGLAGANDKGFLLPAAAIALGPLAFMGGGAAGTAGTAGSAAGTAAGTASGAVPAATAAGAGGILKRGADWLSSPTGQTITNLAGTAYGVSQQAKANDLTRGAIAADQARWQAGAPLREAGLAGLMDPQARDTSSLDRLATQGNPFAMPSAMPASGAVPAGMPSGMPTVPNAPGLAVPSAVPAPGVQPVRPAPRGGAVPVGAPTAKRVR